MGGGLWEPGNSRIQVEYSGKILIANTSPIALNSSRLRDSGLGMEKT